MIAGVETLIPILAVITIVMVIVPVLILVTAVVTTTLQRMTVVTVTVPGGHGIGLAVTGVWHCLFRHNVLGAAV